MDKHANVSTYVSVGIGDTVPIRYEHEPVASAHAVEYHDGKASAADAQTLGNPPTGERASSAAMRFRVDASSSDSMHRRGPRIDQGLLFPPKLRRRRYAGFRGNVGDCVTGAKTVRNLSPG